MFNESLTTGILNAFEIRKNIHAQLNAYVKAQFKQINVVRTLLKRERQNQELCQNMHPCQELNEKSFRIQSSCKKSFMSSGNEEDFSFLFKTWCTFKRHLSNFLKESSSEQNKISSLHFIQWRHKSKRHKSDKRIEPFRSRLRKNSFGSALKRVVVASLKNALSQHHVDFVK